MGLRAHQKRSRVSWNCLNWTNIPTALSLPRKQRGAEFYYRPRTVSRFHQILNRILSLRQSMTSDLTSLLEGGGEKRKLEFEDSPFIQDQPCYKYAAVNRCRECRNKKDLVTDHKTSGDIVCRFQSFRKLMTRRNNKVQTVSPHSGQITGFSPMGFCDPKEDPNNSDFNLWMPSKDELPERLELELSKMLITQLGDQFCRLLAEDKEAISLDKSLGEKRNVSWKRIVDKVREMCDSCATTIFNHHWACETCGFMVCVECFKARQTEAKKNEAMTIAEEDKDEYGWLYCNQNHQVSHSLERMRLIQIIPGNASDEVAKILHNVRRKWRILQECKCSDALNTEQSLEKCQEQDVAIAVEKNVETAPCSKKTHEKVVSSNSDSDEDSDEENESFRSIIRAKKAISSPTPLKVDVTENTANGGSSIHSNGNSICSRNPYYDRSKLPVKVFTKGESQHLWPDLPHEWLCFGMLLRLLSPSHEGNYGPFKDLWKRGQPVLVSKVGDELSKTLWTPESFADHFGKDENDLINCMTGKLIPGEKMQTFWDGFVDVSKRLKDDKGNVMLLKLKDWPPGDDFAHLMPKRFADLMKALPLKEYTHRDGKLNLAARLPNKFMAPDLGPKMYIAYGDGNHLDKGTTNLHLDISDAVNCVVYVGVPKNCDVEQHNKAVHDAIKDSDCDQKTIKRVLENGELPGALWHIYRPWDADKIRDLLNKVSVERGLALEKHHDPIHDQVAYLDRKLRARLREEYNVMGFPIVQCSGDAVFIPAGAPHQVRNLHNCIKIAEDFVSPENVSHCFQLTEEFRNLSDTHTNHEDKLQIKNIVYHAVKDALSVLLQSA